MKAIISEIINDAIWSPTPDNVQNWQFTIEEKKLVVKVDITKWSHPIDPHRNADVLSCGALCEYIVLAAKKRGLNTEWVFTRDQIIQMEFHFTQNALANKNTNDLYPFLKTRRTDRRSYKKTALTSALVNELLETNIERSTKLYLKELPPQKLFNYLRQTDYYFWKNADIAQNTFQHISTDKKAPALGLNYLNTGMTYVEAMTMKFLLKYKKILNWALGHGLAFLISRKTSSLYSQSGGFLLFTSVGTTDNDLFEVGRHATKSWLILTKHNYTAQPLTFSSLSCFQLSPGQKAPSATYTHKKHFEFGFNLFKEVFNLNDNDVPTWLFRVGQSKPMPTEMIPSRLKPQVTDTKDARVS